MRNLGLIISFWLAAIAMPTNSLALGLGEIEVNSFLNQPLSAEIEVISARAGEIDDLLVGLASRDAFSRAGLTRSSSLSDLRFAVKKNEEGDSAVILVTTRASVKEPFLNFLVEADWSKGRLLREFTVLLDPPFYADTPAPAPAPVAETQEVTPEPLAEPVETEIEVEVEPAADQEAIPEPIALSETDASEETEVIAPQTESEPVVEQEFEVETEIEPEEFEVETEVEVESILSPGDVTVVKGDTMWSIASAIQAPGQSVNQIMLAIQRANPGAFNDNNINNMKVGSVLRMPEASEIAELNQQQAYAQVLEQNGLWDDYVARVTGQTPVAVESDGGSEGDSQTAESDAELNLIAPGDGQSDAASLQGEGEDANELRVKLALAEEELDASRVENQELESRIAELEARLSKFEELQKMVEIEDDSLAQLQADQAEEEVVSTEAIDAAQQAADEDELLEELLLEEAADSTATVDTDIMTDESDELVDDSAQQEQATETPPVPVIVTEPVSDSPSLLDGILPPAILDMIPDMGGILPSMDSLALDPVMLGGLGGILLLLIGLVVYKRKKKSDDSDEFTINEPIYVGDEGTDDELTPIHLAEGAFEGLDDLEDESDISLPDDLGITEGLEGFGLEDDEDEAGDDQFARTEVVPSIQAPESVSSAEPATGGDEQDDILNEADVYLAYNLYDNAEELLTQSLESNPERADYRSKLLDTHFATKNADAFIREAETLKSMGNVANRYWDRVMIMGYELAPDNALFAAAKDSDMTAADLEISKPASADFELGVGGDEDDTNFSTTDFDLGEEDTNTFEATSNFSSDDSGIEDNLEIPDLDELPDLDNEDGTDIGLDLLDDDVPDDIGDLDFSLDADEDQEPLAEAEPDDIDFDLPEELDLGGGDDGDADGLYEANIESTAVIEADTAVIDTDDFLAQLDDKDEGYGTDATAVIEIGDDDDLSSYGMDDTAFADSDSDDIGDVELDLSDFEDDGAGSMDIEMDVDNSKTDTFAPGDFDDPEEVLADEDIEGLGIDGIEDLMLPDDVDEVSTKLDLARAFIDMGDAEGARSSLDEVMAEGSDDQKAEATSLLEHL